MDILKDLKYGSHVIWIYQSNNEYESILLELVTGGLSKGERIIFIGPDKEVSRFNRIIGDLSRNEMVFPISTEDIDSFLDETSETSFDSWYNRIINTAYITEDKSIKEILATSAKINRLCTGNTIWICAYNKNNLSPIHLLHLVQAHPYLMVNNKIFNNFIYIPQERIINGTTDTILDLIIGLFEREKARSLELQNTLLLYRSLFEATGTATVIIEDNTIVSVNDAFEFLTGFTKEEVEGKKEWMEFIPLQEDLERMLRYRELRLKDPTLVPKTYETHIRDKYGNIKDIMLTVNTIPGTRKFVASLSDITELKKINKALRILSLANQELIKAESEEELLKHIAEILQVYGDYKDIRIEADKELGRVNIIVNREMSQDERDILNELLKDIRYGIDALRTRSQLEYSEERYKTIFENIPVPLLEIDLSSSVLYLKELIASGIKDIENYLKTHREELDKILALTRILDINKAGLKLFNIQSKEELNDIREIAKGSIEDVCIGILKNIFNGVYEGEFTEIRCNKGENEKYLYLKWITPPRGGMR